MNSNLKKVFDFLTQAEPDNEIPQCDAIFVFGTTDGNVAKHAALLYRLKKAPHIILTGMYGSTRTEGPSSFSSEAEFLASVAEKEGVPRESMILEPKARNTYENVILGIQACREVGFYPKTLILVSAPYLLRRAKACFAKNFPEIKTYGSAMSVNDDYLTSYRIERIKGELPRLIKYAEGGTIVSTNIPNDITKAAELF
jgi:uncharacterized SAM-binding protein YcdF (DUF218 family)